MNKQKLNDPYTPLKLLIIRISFIGLFLAVFRQITFISDVFASICKEPYFFVIVLCNLNHRACLKTKYSKSFIVILLLFMSFTSIFKELLKEIDNDTIFLLFSICQIVYCIDSIGTSLKNIDKSIKLKTFDREEQISLEEGLLLPLNHKDNGIVGCIAFMFGCFCLFSRLKNNVEIVILQGFGFLFYIFLPSLLEHSLIHDRSLKYVILLCSIILETYSLHTKTFKEIGIIIIGVIIMFKTLINLLKNIEI